MKQPFINLTFLLHKLITPNIHEVQHERGKSVVLYEPEDNMKQITFP